MGVSGKKGAITFVFSKVSLMIFAIVITMTLFFTIYIINNMMLLNEQTAVAESMVNVVSAVSASPFRTSVVFSHRDYTISLEESGFRIAGLKKSFLTPINSEMSDKEFSTSCFVVNNFNGTVIQACQ